MAGIVESSVSRAGAIKLVKMRRKVGNRGWRQGRKKRNGSEFREPGACGGVGDGIRVGEFRDSPMDELLNLTPSQQTIYNRGEM